MANISVINTEDLHTLQGLESVTHVTGSVYILGNTKLESLDGLQNIELIEGDLYVYDNYVNSPLFDSSTCTRSTRCDALRWQLTSRSIEGGSLRAPAGMLNPNLVVLGTVVIQGRFSRWSTPPCPCDYYGTLRTTL